MCCLPLSVANSPSFSAFNPASSYKAHIIGADRHDEGSRGHAISEDRHDEGSHRHAIGEDRHDEGGWVYPHAEKTEGARFIYPSNIHTIILHTYTTNNKIRNGKNCHLSDIHTPLRQ